MRLHKCFLFGLLFLFPFLFGLPLLESTQLWYDCIAQTPEIGVPIDATTPGDTTRPSKGSASNDSRLTGKENTLLFSTSLLSKDMKDCRRDRCGSGLVYSENHVHCCLECTDKLLGLSFSHRDYSLKQEFSHSLQNYLS